MCFTYILETSKQEVIYGRHFFKICKTTIVAIYFNEENVHKMTVGSICQLKQEKECALKDTNRDVSDVR